MKSTHLFLRVFLGESLVGMISVLVALGAVAVGEATRVFDSSSLLGWLKAMTYGGLLVVSLSAWMAWLAVRTNASASSVAQQPTSE